MPREITTFVDTNKWVETTCLPRVKVNTKRFPTGLAMIGRKRASDADKNYMGCITTCEKGHPVTAGLNVIGRDKASDVIIKNYSISRIHAIITIVDENQHFVSDFNSFNGTKQNGVNLNPLRLYPLSDNDKLMFGEVEAVYRKGPAEFVSTQESQTDASQSIFEAQTQRLEIENVGNVDTGESSKNSIGPPVNEGNPLPNSTSEIFDKEFHEAPTQVLIDPPHFKEKTPACSPLHTGFHEAETQIINSQELQLLNDDTNSVANDDLCNVLHSNPPNENVNEDTSERETSETTDLKTSENVENNPSMPHSEITHGNLQTVNHSQDSNQNVDEYNASLLQSEVTQCYVQTINHSQDSKKNVDENNASLPRSEITHGNSQTVNKNFDENNASLPNSEITHGNLQTVNHSQDSNKNDDNNASWPYSEITHVNLQTVNHSQDTNKNLDENNACSPHSEITHGSDNLQTVNHSQDSNSSEDFLVLHNKAQEADGLSTQAVETKSNINETVPSDKEEEKDDSKIEEHEQEDTTNNRSLSSTPSESRFVNDKVESDCETDIEESIFVTTNKTNDFTGIISESESEALNDTDVIPATQEVLSEVFAYTKKSKIANNTTESEEDSFRLGLTQMMSGRVSGPEENDTTQTKTDESDIHSAPTQRWSKDPICKDQSDNGENDTSVDRIYIMPTQKIGGCDEKDANINVNEELDDIYFQPTQKINPSKETEHAFPKNTHQQPSIYLMETQKLDIINNLADKSDDKTQETQEFRGYDEVQDVNTEVIKNNTQESEKQDDASLKTATEQPSIFLMETQILDVKVSNLGRNSDSNIHSGKQSKTDSVTNKELPKNDELQNQESSTSKGSSQPNPETLGDIQEVPTEMLLNKDGQDIEKAVKSDDGSKSVSKNNTLFLKPSEVERKINLESEKDQCPIEVIKTSSKNTRSKANTPHKINVEKEIVTSTRAKRKCPSVYKTNEESSEPTTKITKTSEDTPILEKRTRKENKLKSTLSDDNVAKSKRKTNSALMKLDSEMSTKECSSEATAENEEETKVSPKLGSFSNKNKNKSLYDLDEYVEELENDVIRPKPKKILKLPDSQSSHSSSLSDFEDSIIKPKPKRVLKLPDTQTSQEPSTSGSKREISPVLENKNDGTEKNNIVTVEKSEQGLILDIQPTKESSPKEDAKAATKRSKRTLKRDISKSKPQTSTASSEKQLTKEDDKPVSKRAKRTIKPNIPDWKPESPPESAEEVHATVDQKAAVKRSRKTVKSNVQKIVPENLESDEEKHSTKEDGKSAPKTSRRTLRSNIPNPEITPDSDEEKHCPKEDSKSPVKRSRRTLKPDVPKLEPSIEKQSIKEETKPVVEKPKRAMRSKVADAKSESSLESSEDKPPVKEEKKPVLERSRRAVKPNIHSSKSETSSPSSDEKHSFREDGSFLAERSKRTLKPKVVFTLMDDPTLESVIRQLGGSVVDTVEASTVLVTEKVKRTQKLLSAIGYSKPICSPQWIRESKKASKFLDPWDFILSDSEAETKWDFSLLESLKRSSNKKLLDGFVFHIVMNNAVDVLKSAIESCGGKCINKITKKDSTKSLYVVSSPELKSKYSKIAKQHGATVIAAEAIFDGVLRQELKFKNHLLPS